MQLVKYDAMCKAIKACHSVDEVLDIRDKALALEIYAQQAMNTDAERQASEVRLRGERRAGELLTEMREKGERQGDGKPSSDARVTTLRDLGISYDQASKWQQLAKVPEHQFESALRNPAKKPSTKGILRDANPDPVPPIDPDALWVWGRIRDFERDRITDRDPLELFETMTDSMQGDVIRILPSVIAWLKALHRSKA